MGISAAVATFAGGLGASAATAAVVGSVVSGAVIGAGISGAVAAVTGGDVGDAMLMGALTGGIASPISAGVAAVAPSAAAAGSMANAVATGAIIGGGTAAVQGGDVLTGALLGGAGAGAGKYVGDKLGIGGTAGGGVSPVSPDDLAVNNTSSTYGPSGQNMGGYAASAVDDIGAAGFVGDVVSEAVGTIGGGGGGMSALDINQTNQNILNSPIMQGGTGATSPGMGVPSQPVVPTTFTPRIDAAGIAYDAFDNPMGFMDDAGQLRDLSGQPVNPPAPAPVATTTPSTPGSNTLADEFVDLTNENILNSPIMQGGTGATSPGTGILQNYVDDAGNLINTQGQVVKNLTGGFVDRTGMVYDDMGNPVARLKGAQPGIDYTGTLNPGNTITRLDGGDVIDLLGQPVRLGTTTAAPAPGTSLPQTGEEFINQTNSDILNSPLMQGGTGATSPGIGQPVKPVPVGPGGVVPTTQTFGGGSTGGGTGGSTTGGGGSNFGIPPSAVLPISAGVMSGLTTPPRQTPGASGESAWSWGQVPNIVQPGLNPGLYARAVEPFYENAGPNQSQYYWGAHPYAHTMADMVNYNQVPNAPVMPFGPARSAVGGTDALDINEYINQYFNPVQQAATIGSQPQYAGAGGTVMPVMPA